MKKFLLMVGNIALYLGIFYALMYLLRSTYNYEATFKFAKYLEVNPSMFVAVLFSSILVVYVIVFWIKSLIWRNRKQSLFAASGFRKLGLKDAGLMFAMGLAGCLFSIGLIEIDYVAERFPSIPHLVDDLIRGDSIWLVVLGAGFIGPIYEEILFRGLIYGQFRNVMPMYAALVLQALVYAYFQPSLALSVIGLGSGFIYAIMYVRLSSLWAPIIIQVTAMSLIFVAKDAGWYDAIDKLGEPALYVITILSLLVFLAIAFSVWRRGGGELTITKYTKPTAAEKGM
ncbi:CPBP family intramembrane glutamic endopeptidase [Paenibacillus sp. GCM10027627]|uniref:CPBP family intramembrane glutamic endopeptidase n=1 Tax=unclassified Paenibacillus TaxID=185978 RepID=UPI00363CE1BC